MTCDCENQWGLHLNEMESQVFLLRTPCMDGLTHSLIDSLALHSSAGQQLEKYQGRTVAELN